MNFFGKSKKCGEYPEAERCQEHQECQELDKLWQAVNSGKGTREIRKVKKKKREQGDNAVVDMRCLQSLLYAICSKDS